METIKFQASTLVICNKTQRMWVFSLFLFLCCAAKDFGVLLLENNFSYGIVTYLFHR